MRLKKLPSVLQINLNRFGVSPQGRMIKINSRCEFNDLLDFDSIIKGTDSYELSQHAEKPTIELPKSKSQQQKRSNLYRLHAILCHNGSLD